MAGEAKPNDPYAYLLALTDALAMGKSAQERIPDTPTPDADPIERASEAMRGLKLAKTDWECAAQYLSGYHNSTNEPIKISAAAGILAFTLLAEHMDRTVDAYAKLIDAEGQGLGSYLAEQAQISADIDEALKMLTPATAAGTYAIVVAEAGSNKLTRFVLTEAQRAVILQRLRTTFGPSVEKGMQAGQLPLVFAAAALYGFIADPKWQSAPTP